MNLSDETIEEIIKLKGEGLSSRSIAKKISCGKSTVNNYWNKYIENNKDVEQLVKKPRTLVLDLESAPSVVVAFQRFKINVGQDAVLREGGWLLSYAYKWLGEDGKAVGNVLTPDEAINADDSGLCMELWELVEQSDAILYHNGLNFDLPLMKARMIVNGLPPIRKVRSIDSLQLAKEFKLNSNKLDSLCRQLDIGAKLEHSGISLWVDCMKGDPVALSHILTYNKQDVDILEELYLYLAPYSTRHPNMAVNLGDKVRCNICCSDKVKPTGNIISTNLSSFEEYSCECGARFKTRKSITTKEQRSNFLSN